MSKLLYSNQFHFPLSFPAAASKSSSSSQAFFPIYESSVCECEVIQLLQVGSILSIRHPLHPPKQFSCNSIQPQSVAKQHSINRVQFCIIIFAPHPYRNTVYAFIVPIFNALLPCRVLLHHMQSQSIVSGILGQAK